MLLLFARLRGAIVLVLHYDNSLWIRIVNK